MAKKKYKPKVGDEVEFYYGKVKHTGTINWMGSAVLTVYPHSIKMTDNKKQVLEGDWSMPYKDLVGKVTLEEKK